MICIICEVSIKGPEVYGPHYVPQCRSCWVTVGLNSTADLESFNQCLDLYDKDARDPVFVKAFLNSEELYL